jgi:pyruvate/2-oxoglutarate dehydrogenase complex dihydrolipoamide dehydrogenase (E3) component
MSSAPAPAPAPEEFDVVVIGTGSAGKPLAGELAKAGLSVVAIEEGLVGGECAYLACVPSKAMLLAARNHRMDQHWATRHAPAQVESDADAFERAIGVRDRTVRHRSDAHALELMEKEGITVLRGTAVVHGPERTVVVEHEGATRAVRWRRALAVGTGAEAVMPPIPGLRDVPYWLSPQALSGDDRPARLLILGGGAVGVEVAQIFSSFGTRVTLVESGAHLLPRESGWLGEAMAETLRQNGVEVLTGTKVVRAERGDTGAALAHAEEPDGSTRAIETDRILVSVGKKPRTAGFGLESLGIEADEKTGALDVDRRCRVMTENGPLKDVFALGDVTGIAPYTHVANYHARVVAAHLLGHGYDTDHVGIPRVVYTDPAVLATGVTVGQCEERGMNVETACFDATKTSRSAIERTADKDDHRVAQLELIADARTGVLIGASAIGPEADSWAAELALAVRDRMTVHTLAQALHAFPSWTEAIHVPARELAERITPVDSPE